MHSFLFQLLLSFALFNGAVAILPALRMAVGAKNWVWKGHDIRYTAAGEGKTGPTTILIHGFGGNCDHWRKNTAVIGEVGPTYALDLLGYGYSSKPDPGPWENKNQIYNFENWAEQILDFSREVAANGATGGVYLVCNSVGGVAGLQAALTGAAKGVPIRGVMLLDISLRKLHTTKQAPPLRPLVTALQWVLRETPIGAAFFGSVAKPETVRNILQQCYGDPAAVTDELVEAILRPGLQPGAVKVFLDFISYSGGPLPEELLPKLKDVPVAFGWGDKDPWEPVDEGRELYAGFPCVESFTVLEGVGHCPQDEAPHLVNPLITSFILKQRSAARVAPAAAAPA